jgi:predicted acyl esterase
MEPSEGAGLLFKHLPRIAGNDVPIAEMAEAREISQNLGGLPIAIAHCAGWIDKTQSSLSEFSKIYERREGSQKIWTHGSSNTTYQYNKKLDTLWDIALHELSSDAKSVVNLMSMLSPERILEGMLLETFESFSSQLP